MPLLLLLVVHPLAPGIVLVLVNKHLFRDQSPLHQLVPVRPRSQLSRDLDADHLALEPAQDVVRAHGGVAANVLALPDALPDVDPAKNVLGG